MSSQVSRLPSPEFFHFSKLEEWKNSLCGAPAGGKEGATSTRCRLGVAFRETGKRLLRAPSAHKAGPLRTEAAHAHKAAQGRPCYCDAPAVLLCFCGASALLRGFCPVSGAAPRCSRGSRGATRGTSGLWAPAMSRLSTLGWVRLGVVGSRRPLR